MTVFSDPPTMVAASGMRSKNAAPIRIPAPIAMIIPTWRAARMATSPPAKAEPKAPADTRNAISGMSGVRPRRPRLAVQARRAQPEQLEAVLVDPVAGLPGDAPNDPAQVGVADLGGPPTTGADDVVVMRRRAADVGVLAIRQVEAFDRADLYEHVKGPEDRCPADAQSAPVGAGDEVRGREMAVLVGDESGERPARLGQPVAGAIERGDDRSGRSHAPSLARLRQSLNSRSGARRPPGGPRSKGPSPFGPVGTASVREPTGCLGNASMRPAARQATHVTDPGVLPLTSRTD